MDWADEYDVERRVQAWLAWWSKYGACTFSQDEIAMKRAEVARLPRENRSNYYLRRVLLSGPDAFPEFFAQGWGNEQPTSGFPGETREGMERRMSDMIAEGAPPDTPDYVECVECGEQFESDEMHEVFNQSMCEDCSGQCVRCGNRFPADEMAYVDSWRPGDHCEDCYHVCVGCDDPVDIDDAYWVADGWNGGEYAHDRCSTYCDSCGDRSMRDSETDRCPHCNYQPSDGTIDPYGHTYPSRWFGGPVPKDAKGHHLGYYLGVELEISSDVMSAQPIIDWLYQRGLGDLMSFKEDSSVSGFEIVTQPMTPAFFESVDWDGFFEMLNEEYPIYGDEPVDHGMHVHIGRIAFRNDDLSLAAWAYLIGQGDHLERIGRRQPTGYCRKIHHPASAAIAASRYNRSAQGHRLYQSGRYPGRDALNFANSSTVEVRAFKSTRSAIEFRECVRMVYLTADYIRELRPDKYATLPKNALHWDQFTQWVKSNAPEAYPAMADLPRPKTNKKKNLTSVSMSASYDS